MACMVRGVTRGAPYKIGSACNPQRETVSYDVSPEARPPRAWELRARARGQASQWGPACHAGRTMGGRHLAVLRPWERDCGWAVRGARGALN